jgi:hypothetical protein
MATAQHPERFIGAQLHMAGERLRGAGRQRVEQHYPGAFRGEEEGIPAPAGEHEAGERLTVCSVNRLLSAPPARALASAAILGASLRLATPTAPYPCSSVRGSSAAISCPSSDAVGA